MYEKRHTHSHIKTLFYVKLYMYSLTYISNKRILRYWLAVAVGGGCYIAAILLAYILLFKCILCIFV